MKRKRDTSWTVQECNMVVQNWVVTCAISRILEDRSDAARLKHYSGEHAETVRNDNVGFDLRQLAAELGTVQYNPKRFAADILNTDRPKAAVLLFAHGNLVCTGAKTIFMAEFVIMAMAMEIVRLGYKKLRIRPGSFQVQNVVASARLPDAIDLDKLFSENSEYCTYDPKIFPGASLRPSEIHPKTVLVFPSGNLVATGGQNEDDLRNALEVTLPMIYRCRKRKRIRTNKKIAGS